MGKAADIVVLTADPIADIRNTREIEAIVRDGELFDPEALLTNYPQRWHW